MKTLLTVLACLFLQSTSAQFAIVSDTEGFVNVRNAPSNSGSVVDTLSDGQIVYCLEPENNWFPVDYGFKGTNKSGFIHKSRLRFIENFEKFACTVFTDTSMVFQKDSQKISISVSKFNSKVHRIQFAKEHSKKAGFIQKIDGKPYWGTDGNVPKIQYKWVDFQSGKIKIKLPSENLFESNLQHTSVFIRENAIFITALNGDAAGAYAVLWQIENGNFKQRIITIPF